MKNIIVSNFLALFIVCFSTLAFAASSGVVVTVKPYAWVERNGQKIPLKLKSVVEKGDVLSTDAKGMVQIIFSDDTTISLGANAKMTVTDFIFDKAGSKPSFSVDIVSGAVRFVTGKVVQQNRSGFNVVTPHATVGIRGTTFLVNVSAEKATSVVGLDVNPAFPISVTNITTGAVSSIDISGVAIDATLTGNTSYKVPAGTFSQSSASFAGDVADAGSDSGADNGSSTSGSSSGGGSSTSGGSSGGGSSTSGGSSSGGSGHLSEGGASSGASSASSSDSGVLIGSSAVFVASMPSGASYGVEPVLTTPLEEIAKDFANKPGNIGPGGGTKPPVSGKYEGKIMAPGGVQAIGTFSFKTSLTAGSGSITNTKLEIEKNYGAGIKAKQEGSSNVTGGVFDTTLKVSSSPNAQVGKGNLGNMSGTLNGNTVSGQWDILNNNGAPMFAGGSGGFEGKFSKQ